MKNLFVKKIYLICLLLSAFPVLYFNFKGFLVGHDDVQVLQFLGTTNYTELVGVISALFFLFVVIHFHYRKTNLLWLLLPFAGTIIFSVTKLLERTSYENYSS